MTKAYYFRGTCKWAKVRKPDDRFGNYTIDLYLDDESWNKYEDSGLELKVREDEDGKFLKFRRPEKKEIKGDVVHLGPPSVVFNTGETDDQGRSIYEDRDDNVLVGNGSVVVCRVHVYETVRGLGHTLEAVAVDDLVEYDGGVEGAGGENNEYTF